MSNVLAINKSTYLPTFRVRTFALCPFGLTDGQKGTVSCLLLFFCVYWR